VGAGITAFFIRLERKVERKRSPTNFWPIGMGKSEEEIQPLNPEDSLVEITTGEDSPKSKSPRHGHSTSKEVIITARSRLLFFCTAPNSVIDDLPDQSRHYLATAGPDSYYLCCFQVASAVTSSWVSRRFLSGW